MFCVSSDRQLNLRYVYALGVYYLPHKCVALILEDAYLLYCTIWRKCLLQYLLVEKAREGAIDAATVYGAVSRAALVINLIKGQRFDIH